MKKISLFLSGLLLAGMANAQYFHKTYSNYSTIGNGMSVRYTGSGHLLGGATINPPAGVAPLQSLVVTRTDIDGDFTTPANFNNIYVINDATTGAQLHVTDARIVEYSNGSGYAAMGSYTFTNSGSVYAGLFYMQIDLLGNPLLVNGYVDVSAALTTSFRLVSITESSAVAGDIFAVGTAYGGSTSPNIFVMRIDNAGNLLWSNIYYYTPAVASYPAMPADILESPYRKELMIVGTSDRHGLWIVLDPITGAMITANEYILGGDESFSSIAVSNDPVGPGFILSGSSNIVNGVNYQMMAVKAGTKRAILWANTYTGASTGIEQKGTDIVGRLNTAGRYEYYMAGQNYSIPGSVSDIQAFKIDEFGIGIPLGLFEYAIPGSVDVPASIDITNSAPGTGLGIYSSNFGPVMNMHITKAYFNGITACYDSQVDPVTISQSFVTAPLTGTIVSRLRMSSLKYVPPIPYTANKICYARAVSGGSNLKGAYGSIQAGEGSMTTAVYPNPLTADTKALTVEVISSIQQTMNINLTDVLGRTVYTHSFTLSEGQSRLKIDLGNAQLAPGFYNLAMQSATITENHKVMVE